MNVLIINSSPRRNGNISRLLQKATETAAATGATCNVVNLYDKDIRQCKACMVCRKKLLCPIPDDMPAIAEDIKAADRIIIGAPCYWGNMPGILKTMFDRLVYLFIAHGKGPLPVPLLKGRRALIISISNTPMPIARLFGQTSGTVKSIGKILRLGGIKTIPSLQIGGMLRRDITDNHLRQVDKKVKKLLK